MMVIVTTSIFQTDVFVRESSANLQGAKTVQHEIERRSTHYAEHVLSIIHSDKTCVSY